MHDPVVVSDYDEYLAGAGRRKVLTGIGEPPAFVGIADSSAHLARQVAAGSCVIETGAFGMLHRNVPDEVRHRLVRAYARVLREVTRQGFLVEERVARRPMMAAESFADAAHFPEQGGYIAAGRFCVS